MPLRDHFHPPLQLRYPWDSFHSSWATRLADALNDQWLPPEFIAAEHTHAGPHLGIDVATFERPPQRPGALPNGPPAATLATGVWAPPAAAHTMPAVFPDTFEVRVFATTSGLTLVGNFGNGKINVFSSHGDFIDELDLPNDKPLVIDGLWKLTLGGGAVVDIMGVIGAKALAGTVAEGAFGGVALCD